MNKARRKALEDAKNVIERAKHLIENGHEELRAVLTDEMDAYDNLPESLQSGDKGDEMEGNISELEQAEGELETIKETMSTLVTDIESALESIDNVA